MISILLATALLFSEDFEQGLDRWEIRRAPYIRIIDSGDQQHGKVLLLETAGDQYALIKGSQSWGSVRIEGDVLFPTNEDNYVGVIYNFRRRGKREDFGLVYIKGTGSYLWANPHRDNNVSRLVYPELKPPLTGVAAIEIGKWQHVKVEVAGRVAHFYVGEMTTPQMTFPFFEFDSGAIGFQPRCCGGPVWIDNIRVTSIDKLSYEGPMIPAIAYKPESLITMWEMAGPFAETDDDIAREPSKAEWKPFPTDARGAVITAMVVDYLGPNSVAYFRTRVKSDAAREATLALSTADDLAIWINGRFCAFQSRGDAAWFDFATNGNHPPRRVKIDLHAGTNDIVIRVRGGISATGGFFARVE